MCILHAVLNVKMQASSDVYPLEGVGRQFYAVFQSDLGHLCPARPGSATKWAFVVHRGGSRRDYPVISGDVASFVRKCTILGPTAVTVGLIRGAGVTTVILGLPKGVSITLRR